MTVTRAVWGQIEKRDYTIMRRVHRWQAPRWIRLWMICSTRMGDGWFWYGLGAILLLFGGPSRFAAAGAGAFAAASAILVFRVMKNASRRSRPCQLEPHCWARVLPPDQFSFPSGHTITAFGVAIAVGLFYPTLQLLLLVVAVSIALSRIVLGMHFLSDVVAGALIGSILGYTAFHLFR